MGDLVQLPPAADKVDVKHRRKWLVDLSLLVSPDFPLSSLEAMTNYLPFLEHLPDAAFTRGSLGDVAMAARRTSTPSLKELGDPLEAWWREHRLQKPVLRVPRAPLKIAAPVAPDPAVTAQVRSLVASLRGGAPCSNPIWRRPPIAPTA